MKVKPEQLERLAALLVASYRTKELMIARSADAELKHAIIGIIRANFAEEEAIEEEARKVLAAHAGAAKEMDAYKMFLLAKQKLAAKKGFIL